MSVRQPILDAEHPWPGLFPYGEEAHAFFNGRELETADLMRLVRRNPCTLFYGQSGLGKSSLLRAGLFPALRAEGFLPVYMRLDFRNAGLALRDQVWEMFSAALAATRVDGRRPRADESLWEYFHAADVELWDEQNRLLTPVLVLDQFEEIVQAGEERVQQGRLAAFLEELAGLVENRIPAGVTARLERDAEAVSTLDFNALRYRCVIGFREDFLPALQDRFAAHRMGTHSRLRITKMAEAQAMAAVQKTGAALVDAEVSQRIVAFVAGAGGHTAARTLEVEPALLSVVCFELNNRRIARGEARISPDLLAGAQDQIIAEFYQRSLADQDDAVARFIERELLTESGYRDSCAVEDAVQRHGIAAGAIQQLVERRVLRQDERFGVLRVELTHDVLAPVVRANRDKRQAALAFEAEREREAARLRRTRRLLWIGGALAAFASVLVVVFYNLFREANAEKARVIEAQSTLFLSRANASLENNIPAEPVQFLARALNLNPENQGAIGRLASIASHRRFARLAWQTPFRFGGDGVGTVQVLDESGFAFLSPRGDMSAIDLRMAGNVPTLAESCAIRTFTKPGDSPLRTVVHPPPVAAKAEGLARIATSSFDGAAGFAGTAESQAFAESCGAQARKRSKGKSITRNNIIGMERGSRSIWVADGGVPVRVDSKTFAREALPKVNDLGTPRNALAGANGKAVLLAGDRAAGLYVRPGADASVASFERIALFTGTGGDAGERAIQWYAALDDSESLVLVASDAGACEMWDLAARKRLWEHRCAGYGHAFVPGKAWIGMFNDRPRSYDGAMPGSLLDWSLVEARSGRALGKLVRTQAINQVGFSGDGTRVVVAAQDRTATVYELPSLARSGAALLHEGAVVEAHFIPGRDDVVTAAFDGSARVWNWRSGELLTEPMVHPGPVLFARPVLGGSHVLSIADDQRLRLWRIAPPPAAARPVLPAVLSPAISKSGEWLAMVDGGAGKTAGTDGARMRVQVAKVSALPSMSGALGAARTLFEAPGAVSRMAFNEAGQRLAIAGVEAWLAVVGVADGKVTHRLKLPAQALRMQFSADDRRLVVQTGDAQLRVYDLATGRESGLAVKLDGSMLDFGVSDDSRWLTAVSTVQVQIADLTTGYPVANLTPGGIIAAAVHPAKPEAAFSVRGSLAVWRPRIGTRDFERIKGGSVAEGPLDDLMKNGDGIVEPSRKLMVGLRYLGDGATLAAFSVDGAAWTWELAGMRAGPVLRHSNAIVAMRASEDGRWLATTALDGLTRIWDHRSGQLMTDAIALEDPERDFVLMGPGTWALVEKAGGRYEPMMLGLGFPGQAPDWLVPTVAALANIDIAGEAPGRAALQGSGDAWWQAWLGYVSNRNGAQEK